MLSASQEWAELSDEGVRLPTPTLSLWARDNRVGSALARMGRPAATHSSPALGLVGVSKPRPPHQ